MPQKSAVVARLGVGNFECCDEPRNNVVCYIHPPDGGEAGHLVPNIGNFTTRNLGFA